MTQQSLRLIPGLNVEKTPSLNEAGYSIASLGRFKAGLFQKLGGWTRFYNNTFTSAPMACHAWQDLNNTARLAVGTASQLAAIDASNNFKDLTPQATTTNGALPASTNFTTTAGSAVVTVTDGSISNVQPFDAVFFGTPVIVGGLVLSGLYQVTAFTSLHAFTITASKAATGSVASGGSLPTLASTSGSSSVTVTVTAHGLSVGLSVVFPVATTFNGVTVSGLYQIATIVDANNFTIIVSNSASGTGSVTMNSGNCSLTYYLATGPVSSSVAYGVGNYGDGLYNYGATPGVATGTPVTATDWTLTNWGELLVACPQNQPIFYWGPSSGFITAQVIGTGPAYASGCFMSTGNQMLIAYGASVTAGIGVYQDPLWVQWCDQSNLAQWTPASNNQAGGYRIPSGARTVGGLSTPTKDLIWTDVELWAMTYIGQPYVFGFNKVGLNCGLIAKHAATALSGTVYWMSSANLFEYGGAGVQVMPCPIWDLIFQDLNKAYVSTCFLVSNTLFNEVWIFFPSSSGNATRPDKYAKVNVLEQTWDSGPLSRSCGIDQSVLGNPVLCAPDGSVYSHENGTSAAGLAFNPVMETGWFCLNEGEDVGFISKITPDFKYGSYHGPANANITITVYGCMYPDVNVRTYGPYTIAAGSEYIIPRVRQRYMKLRIEDNSANSFWRIGRVQFRYQPSGRR